MKYTNKEFIRAAKAIVQMNKQMGCGETNWKVIYKQLEEDYNKVK